MNRVAPIAFILAAAATPALAENPLLNWKRQSAPHAAWAFTSTADGSIRVELRDGDCSNDRRTPECLTGRERAELVDPVPAARGATTWYGYSLLVPDDAPVLPVHVTLGQWWSPAFTIAVREREGRFELAVYAKDRPVSLCPVDKSVARRGVWARFLVSLTIGAGSAGTVAAFANGQPICSRTGSEVQLADGRTPMWKLGIYRPTIGRLPRPHPAQWVLFRDIRKGAIRGDVE